MNKREYARHRGCNESSVRKAITSGRISTNPDGTIDPKAADKQWTPSSRTPARPKRSRHRQVAVSSEALDQVRAAVGKGPNGHDGDVLLVDARLAKMINEAEQARLKTEQMRSRLIDREQVERQVFARFRQSRDAWVSWPARVSALMATELGIDQADVVVVLEQHVQEQLADLSSHESRAIESQVIESQTTESQTTETQAVES